MASEDRPGETGKTGSGGKSETAVHQADLDRRRTDLHAALASRRPASGEKEKGSTSGGAVGYGNALRLSSEFVAGILVGVAIGWSIDYLAGTSPFGLIVFLLLGFCAGVLNVMRSAGVVATRELEKPDDPADRK